MSALVLVLPLPPTRNRRDSRHWGTKAKEKERYYLACLAALRAQGARAPQEPIPRATARAVVRAWNPQDDDNCMARLKWAIDALVHWKYLADDRRKCLRWESLPDQITDRRNPATVTITLTPEG